MTHTYCPYVVSLPWSNISLINNILQRYSTVGSYLIGMYPKLLQVHDEDMLDLSCYHYFHTFLSFNDKQIAEYIHLYRWNDCVRRTHQKTHDCVRRTHQKTHDCVRRTHQKTHDCVRRTHQKTHDYLRRKHDCIRSNTSKPTTQHKLEICRCTPLKKKIVLHKPTYRSCPISTVPGNESITQVYSRIKDLYTRASSSSYVLLHALYPLPVCISIEKRYSTDVNERQFGIRALEDIPQGQIIWSEKIEYAVYLNMEHLMYEQFVNLIKTQPAFVNRLYPRGGNEREKIALNCMDFGDEIILPKLATLLNHSCAYNAKIYRHKTSPYISIVANRDIHKNEEITIRYTTQLYEKDSAELPSIGFQCKCDKHNEIGIIPQETIL
jgi:hypothetical protein